MSDSKELVQRGVMAAAERYSDAIVLRAAVAAIPTFGGPIDAVLSTLVSRAQTARIFALLDALTTEVARIGAAQLKAEFFESEEWVNAVVEAFTAASKTRGNDLIQTYARILLGSGLTDTFDMPEASSLIAVLAELSPIEVAVARVIVDMPGNVYHDDLRQERRNVTDASWDYVMKNIPSAAKPNLTFHLKRLERSGLISEITGGYGGSVGRYEPTSTLARIAVYLRVPNDDKAAPPTSIRSQL